MSKRPCVRGTGIGAASLGAWALVGLLAGLAGGCASPFPDKQDRDFRRAVRESSERELAEARLSPELQRLVREDRTARLDIRPEIMRQLQDMAGPTSYAGKDLPLGPSLYGSPQPVVRITLERAISGSVQHNLNVEFARLAPAISQQQLVAAEAAFDWVVFVNSQATSTNQPQAGTSFTSLTGRPTRTNREVLDVTAGARRPLVSGGQLTLQGEATQTLNKSPGITQNPNPSRDTNFVIQLDQPLLRGFGSDVAMAQVRLARNAEIDSVAELKGTLLQNVNDVEQAYWNLVRAQSDLQILQRLLDRGDEVFRVLKNRREYDTKPANYSNAAATTESRRADVLRAQRVLRDASDQLKTLINDPEFPVGSEVLLLPADAPIEQPVEFSLVDAVNSALANRPEIRRALISLDNTSIRQVVADNGRLPRLDMRALTRFNGEGATWGGAFDQQEEARTVDYQIGLNFEQPLGNRAAEAQFRQRRLERMQATIAYRNTVQGIVGAVKSALRDVQTQWTLIEQTRTARIAATEDLRTLQVEEETIGSLTPEFLNLKLTRQQALAAAEQQEVTALTDYNVALARLYTATGTGLERNKIDFNAPNIRLDPRTSNLFPDYPLEPRRPSDEEIRVR
jgi:outer membrane protein TolC